MKVKLIRQIMNFLTQNDGDTVRCAFKGFFKLDVAVVAKDDQVLKLNGRPFPLKG